MYKENTLNNDLIKSFIYRNNTHLSKAGSLYVIQSSEIVN